MRIKVGYADYTVKAIPPERDNGDDYGSCDPVTQTIYLSKDVAAGAQASTLIHELIHACFQTTSLPDEGLTEEDVCRGLEGPLTALLRDNPKLPGLIRKALNEAKPIV